MGLFESTLPRSTTPSGSPAAPGNFLRQAVGHDVAIGTYSSRRWGGGPGDARHHAGGELDWARIRTRFPPEPNGYLHIGHAKSISVNFGLARDYQGACHLRLDDTNPDREDLEYVESIKDAVQWLGYDWEAGGARHLYQASDYFDFMYRAAEYLIEAGLAYVDEQSAEQLRTHRGDFTRPGLDSPFRNRSAAENLHRFREMRDGKLPEGAAILRARIDMASPNINLRDPALYRIKYAHHHNTGNKWCIYPMYTFAHPIEDALENITHSIATLEFEDQRPFYDWLLSHLARGGLINSPPPRQYEFARLNLTYVVTSKRKLKQLVDEGHVDGWDDPRMPTIVGLRRRGCTPGALQLFAERIGVSKADSWIDYSVLEGALRDDLEPTATRAMAVLDPVRLVISNWDDVMGAGHLESCSAWLHPRAPERGERKFFFGRDLWVERADYSDSPSPGFFRLAPGNIVRLKSGYVVRCTGAVRTGAGELAEIHAEVLPETKSGTPGAAVKVKGTITWVSAADGVQAEVRLYERLFTVPQPGGGHDSLDELHPASARRVRAYVEPSLGQAAPEQHFQFERLGYFVADRVDHAPGHGKLVFNRITSLKETFTG
ncbi:glutamine--tRNA ligase/YqeY domain fusion protein [Ramlibacter algicola]|uniref:Glutamine--tRNA ligase n=1 Tax=Ramlibacter algicola TaxID=2795217 RepID=A0A934Q046_9BURK|nr:glutamine--tRNA ligase/YqeY domain fusion protein [Ramlibacter algicola]MBK0392608.1 glutamine--tRNA ligase/YqeY domain fusion protein [Ramlibacter algicola]